MEIGSEYHIDFTDLEACDDNIFTFLKDYNIFLTNYGRSALGLLYQYIIAESGRRDVKVLLPSYICDSVLKVFPKENIVFYDLKEEFVINEDSIVNLIESGDFDNGIFYLMHYFGNLVSNEILERIKVLCLDHYMTIIEDTTHSIFTLPCTIGDFCIASLRKWMAIPEGGVVYSRNPLPDEWNKLSHAHASHKIEAMVLKNLFLEHAKAYTDLEGMEFVNYAYRKIFVNEEINAGKEVQGISDLSKFILKAQNIDEIKNARKNNYQHLSKRLQDSGIFLYNEKKCDYMEELVPFTAILLLDEKNSRDSLRGYLEEHKIYCAVHWIIGNEKQLGFSNTKKWSERLISLPIDQRYGTKEMDYLANNVISYLKEKKI